MQLVPIQICLIASFCMVPGMFGALELDGIRPLAGSPMGVHISEVDRELT